MKLRVRIARIKRLLHRRKLTDSLPLLVRFASMNWDWDSIDLKHWRWNREEMYSFYRKLKKSGLYKK